MEVILFKLGLIAAMLGLVWLVMRGIVIKMPAADRRGDTDFYKIYNSMDGDHDETLLDRRARHRREDFEDRTETLFTPRDTK